MANFLNYGEIPEARYMDEKISSGSNPLSVASTMIQPPSNSGPCGELQRSGSAKRRRWEALQLRMKKRADILGIPYSAVSDAYTERRARRLAKNEPKEIEDYLAREKPEGKAKHFLDIRLCRSSPRSPEFDATCEDEFDVYVSYQAAVHKEKAKRVKRERFFRFLVDAPYLVEHDKHAEAAGAPQFGIYHQQYWLDGKRLIAVGVIELLPGGMSSVYLLYDPEFSCLNLGTYGALREIAFVRHLQRTYGPHLPAYADFKYYYMGLYVQSNAKMSYKGQFSPSYLLCPETSTFAPLELCRPIIASGRYAAFNTEEKKEESAAAAAAVGEEDEELTAACVLPYSSEVASVLSDRGDLFTVEEDDCHGGGGRIVVTTLAAVADLVDPETLRKAREWARLVGARRGTMRISFLE